MASSELVPGSSSDNNTMVLKHLPQAASQISNNSQFVVASEQVVQSLTTGNHKRIITFVDANSHSDVKWPKLAEMAKSKNKHKNKDRKLASGASSPHSTVSESDEDSTSLEGILDQDTPIEGSPFEIEVKTSLRLLTRASFCNKKTKTAGLVR